MKDQLPVRGSAGSYPEPLRHAPNAALLIDFDNVTMGIRSDFQERLRNLLNSELFKGKISVQRAYADWRRYPQYIVPLSEASIDLIFAPAFGSNKKNATDIRLAIDALELVFTRPEIGTYILLSGDSDFSSLVLKLKEYGKYVIGVGIRESSSDLLIQNCDEYYAYSELTGLLKEGEIEHRRRDPWELVIEATMRMKQNDDVMRSDRLKQVMQEIDKNFDEKDAGYNKYSKFLVEAGRRGLLRLSKLENGQYEIDLGTNANVPPDVESAASAAAAAGEARARRRRPDRGRRDRAGAGHAKGMTLAEGFDLLQAALMGLGAMEDEAAEAEQVRAQMVQLAVDGTDPILEGTRFQRFLRQAHDAGVIDLAKSDDSYRLKLRPQPKEDEETAADESAREQRAASRPRRGSRPRGGRSRRGGSSPETPPADEAPVPGQAVAASAAAEPAPPQRNPRYRRGSRGAPEPREPAPTAEVADDELVRRDVPANRSLRGRPGSRGRGRGAAASKEPSSTERDEAPKPSSAPPTEPAAEAVPDPAQDAGGSLLKRMSAALQRAVLGPQEPDRNDGD